MREQLSKNPIALKGGVLYQIRLNTYIMFGGGEGGKCGEIEGEKVWIELSTYTHTV
ncbi:MAG: hypothetical protein SWX82_26160 [Cyanobacteriota bacterium]|nr:hypothetical protein [Cyanobacteriota bacterium]